MWQAIRNQFKRILRDTPREPDVPLTQEQRAQRHSCVAHRGFSGAAPENTMAAFKLALAQPYVGWMELDVHLSKDDVPVVIHDSTLGRTTNVKGNVRERTAEQLGRLDAGSWFDRRFSAEGVPTLDLVLALAAGRCKLNIELKGHEEATEDERKRLARRSVDVIRARGMAPDAVVTSFQPSILQAVREYDPTMRIGLIIDDAPADLVPRMLALGATTLSIGHRHLSRKLLEDTERAGIGVMAWTINSPGDLRKLTRLAETFQLCTNYPDRWEAAVRQGD